MVVVSVISNSTTAIIGRLSLLIRTLSVRLRPSSTHLEPSCLMASVGTQYEAACEAVGRLLQEAGRKAILRSELVPHAPAHACDRALRHFCESGELTRVGQGIYGIGAAKVFEIVPEVMPKLGYRILPGGPVRGYSQKAGGAVWRLDRPCRRLIRKRGVQAMFETPNGRPVASRQQGSTMEPMQAPPTRSEIDAHFHTFERCHSPARAEKDLIVRRALVAMERFRSARATLAIEGGTALVAYHRLTTRFSEDLDIRLIPSESVRELADEERIEALKEIGQEFKEHIHAEMPFLQPTRKGRIRKDAFIYNYQSSVPDEEVIAGLKFEVVHIPLMMPTVEQAGLAGERFGSIHPVEIASGKWQALTTRLPRNADSYPDLVRHVHDLAALRPALIVLAPEAARETMLKGETTHESVAAVLEELARPVWREHYESYMRRMGVLPVTDWPNSHPTWDTVLANFTALAGELGLTLTAARP
ncbi:MAG: nucleotidyl transferase AbiEii/AbiGii toxin family protein [Gammaproteobacteria bacterium]|nr:nucleotidyl transferase AbiEii/AbiGii toxin family protein [Gammaproteobacteria bacterium]